MRSKPLVSGLLAALALAAAGLVQAHGPQDEGAAVSVDFTHAIPNLPGKSLVAVEVDYAPGGSSPAHTHAKSAFIYAHVVSGQIESKVGDGPARIYKAGESFYEDPGSHHAISRNPSKTQPAKLLAVFVVDSTETDSLTTFEK